MVHRKHEIAVEHSWSPPAELPEDRSITAQTCTDCGGMRRTLHLRSGDSESEPVTSEKVFQTMGSLWSQIQNMFTNLTGFENSNKALNKLKGRYWGLETNWQHITIKAFSDWLHSPGPDPEAKALLVWAQGPVCNRCDVVPRTLKELTVDHMIPKSKGGPSRLCNYQLLCGCCNVQKGDSMPTAIDQSPFASEEESVPCLHSVPCTYFL